MTYWTKFLKSVSDQTRLRILLLLRERALCVCELVEITGETQPKISQHLAKLRDASLVVDEKGGQRVFYRLSLSSHGMNDVLDILHSELQDFSPMKKDIERLNAKKLTNDFFNKD